MYHQQDSQCGSKSKFGKKDKESGLGILKLKFLQNFPLKLYKEHKLLQDKYSLLSMYHRWNSKQIHNKKRSWEREQEMVTNNLNNGKTWFFSTNQQIREWSVES